ncbi:MAG: CDP-diacylglycerol--serine O-phosphatidyltransferase [Polyangiaceae bacterium]
MFKRSAPPGGRRRINLRKTLFILPNLVTLSSVFCGFDSIRLSTGANNPTSGGGDDDFHRAAILIVFAMIFDMLDGRVARMTKTQSAFGLQIDSLADVISFGVAPAMLVYQWSLQKLGTVVGLIASFVYVACAAIRLARFNVIATGDDGKPGKPSKFFLGLPSPGAAGLLVSIVVANHAASGLLGRSEYSWIILVITVLTAFLMVSNVQFRTFKDVRPNLRTSLFVAFAVGSSIVILLKMKPSYVLVWLLGFYVLLGIFETLWRLPARIRERRAAASSTNVPPNPPPAD